MAPADTANAFYGPAGQAPAAPKLKVFISYSRTDTAFADELLAGLEYDGGIDVFLDRHNVHEAENWRERLGALIAGADVFVLLVSPASVSSDICVWEIEHAQELSKRIVPVLIDTVEQDQVHAGVRSLNYVRFDEGRSFMAGLISLRRALSEDLDWVREHTRLLTRAQEWDAAGRIENRLLSGPDIEAAKAWLAGRPSDAPPPLELHHDYISASEHAENARLSVERKQAQELKDAVAHAKRSFVIAAGLAVVASVAGGIAAWQWTIASQNEADYFIYTEEAEARFAEYDTYIAELEAELDDLLGLAEADLENEEVMEEPLAPAPPGGAESGAGQIAQIQEQEMRIAELMDALDREIASRNLNRSIQDPLPDQPGDSAAETISRNARYIDYLERELAEVRMSASVPRSRSTRPIAPRLPEVYEQKQMQLEQMQMTTD